MPVESLQELLVPMLHLLIRAKSNRGTTQAEKFIGVPFEQVVLGTPGERNAYIAMIANSTLDAIEKKVGGDIFRAAQREVKSAVGQRRQERKVNRRAQLISNPAVAAKRKTTENQRKGLKKKRRLDEQLHAKTGRPLKNY